MASVCIGRYVHIVCACRWIYTAWSIVYVVVNFVGDEVVSDGCGDMDLTDQLINKILKSIFFY